MRNFILALAIAFSAAACGGSVEADHGAGSDADLKPVPPDAATPLDSATTPDASPKPDVPPAEGQKILFEMSYVNYAWAPRVTGFYVTVDGSVFQYDYYASSPDAGEPFISLIPGMSEEQVTNKHGPSPELLTKIDKGVLLQRFGLVGGARTGTLLSQYLCADAGEARFVAYLYDPATSSYTPVMLGSNGDRATKNTAPEAQELMQWLSTVGPGQEITFCDYRALSCDKELCDGTPACSPGQVPMGTDEEACFKDCASPLSCDHVASCSTCGAAGAGCIIDQLGLAHCTHYLGGCTDTLSCECGGDQVCAGGKEFCQGDEVNGLRCIAP